MLIVNLENQMERWSWDLGRRCFGNISIKNIGRHVMVYL